MKWEVRCQMTDDRRQKTEDRKQMSEVRCQKSDDRCLKWEVGPVVVPKERDYAAAKDAEVGTREHSAEGLAHGVKKSA